MRLTTDYYLGEPGEQTRKCMIWDALWLQNTLKQGVGGGGYNPSTDYYFFQAAQSVKSAPLSRFNRLLPGPGEHPLSRGGGEAEVEIGPGRDRSRPLRRHGGQSRNWSEVESRGEPGWVGGDPGWINWDGNPPSAELRKVVGCKGTDFDMRWRKR